MSEMANDISNKRNFVQLKQNIYTFKFEIYKKEKQKNETKE